MLYSIRVPLCLTTPVSGHTLSFNIFPAFTLHQYLGNTSHSHSFSEISLVFSRADKPCLTFPVSTSNLSHLNQIYILVQPCFFSIQSLNELCNLLLTKLPCSTPLRHHFLQEAFLSPPFGASWHSLTLFSYLPCQNFAFPVSFTRLYKLCTTTLLYCFMHSS